MISIPEIEFPDFIGILPEQPTSPGGDPGTIKQVEAQHVALLYEAAFDRKPDIPGLNYWIDQFEGGMSLFEIAVRFIASDEFKDLYKDPAKLSNAAFVDILYLNVLDRPGEEGGFNYWLGQLDGGESRQSVLTKFAVSAENYEGSPYITSIANDGGGYWDFAI